MQLYSKYMFKNFEKRTPDVLRVIKMNTAYYIVCTKVQPWLIGDLVTWHVNSLHFRH